MELSPNIGKLTFLLCCIILEEERGGIPFGGVFDCESDIGTILDPLRIPGKDTNDDWDILEVNPG